MSVLPAFVSVGDAAFFYGGFAVCWFFKEPITKFVLGAESYTKNLEAKVKALKAKL